MKENFMYIEPEKAKKILEEVKVLEAKKYGVNSQVYMIDEYVVLKTKNINVRNVSVKDAEMKYFDQLMITLRELKKQGVNVVPILGYTYDPDNEHAEGYIIQEKAKGQELFDDSILMSFYVFSQGNQTEVTPSAKDYILDRTSYISKIPQSHYDKFIEDVMVLLDNQIMVDFFGKSNFFYSEVLGFQFIDLNAHSDYFYGLTENKLNVKDITSIFGFTPCHYKEGESFLSHTALADEVIATELSDNEIESLKNYNRLIFLKCRSAMINNGISEEQVCEGLKKINIF